MKTFKVVMPVLVYLIISVPAFAQDFGTLIHFSSENSLWNTDWSLDGKWITFGYGEDIWIVSTVDGTKKNLTLEIEDDCSFPVFSPDGSEVMFSCRFIHESKQASSTLRSINIETGNISIVMEEAYSGSYSRDGNYLVYIYWPDPDNHVNMCHAVHNLENNKTEYYDFFGNAPPYFNFGNSQMSPDNTYFVTTLGKIGGQDNSENPDALYRVYLDGSVEEILSDGAPWYPKFSPDGKWILYTRWDYSDMDVVRNKPARAIYVYNMETGETINPIPNNSYWSLCGSWSPDGKKIC
ncbi:MAG: PD40 domain-containing protein, partial [Candidatus Latescibacteria bacterium]|nr:PD40 domain-containing protein [Candidatus Latescibacterota bacterium]